MPLTIWGAKLRAVHRHAIKAVFGIFCVFEKKKARVWDGVGIAIERKRKNNPTNAPRQTVSRGLKREKMNYSV